MKPLKDCEREEMLSPEEIGLLEWESATLDMSFTDDYKDEVAALLQAQVAKCKARTPELRVLNELHDVFRKYNLVLVGDDGVVKAYNKFMVEHGVELLKPTQRQQEILDHLVSVGGIQGKEVTK